MSDKSTSAAGRVLSELYREDQERREEPVDAPRPSRRDRSEDDDHRHGDRAA